VDLKTSTKPPIPNLIHEFFINMVFTMACPNFKKGLKMAFGPLGVNRYADLTFISVAFLVYNIYNLLAIVNGKLKIHNIFIICIASLE